MQVIAVEIFAYLLLPIPKIVSLRYFNARQPGTTLANSS